MAWSHWWSYVSQIIVWLCWLDSLSKSTLWNHWSARSSSGSSVRTESLLESVHFLLASTNRELIWLLVHIRSRSSELGSSSRIKSCLWLSSSRDSWRRLRFVSSSLGISSDRGSLHVWSRLRFFVFLGESLSERRTCLSLWWLTEDRTITRICLDIHSITTLLWSSCAFPFDESWRVFIIGVRRWVERIWFRRRSFNSGFLVLKVVDSSLCFSVFFYLLHGHVVELVRTAEGVVEESVWLLIIIRHLLGGEEMISGSFLGLLLVSSLSFDVIVRKLSFSQRAMITVISLRCLSLRLRSVILLP